MTGQHHCSDGEQLEAPPAQGCVTVRLTIAGTTYETTCADEGQARTWLHEQAVRHAPARQKEVSA